MALSADAELAEAISRLDDEAFKIFYFRYWDSISQYVFRRVLDRDATKDIVQDVFLRVYESRKKVDPQKSLKSYLYKIARNLAIDYMRSRSNQRSANPSSDIELQTTAQSDDELK